MPFRLRSTMYTAIAQPPWIDQWMRGRAHLALGTNRGARLSISPRRPVSSASGGCLRHLLDHARLVRGRRVNLEHLDVVRALQLVVHDGRRLQHAVALTESVLPLPFVDEADPPLEDVEHLEVAQVLMQAGGMEIVGARPVLLDADHVGAELPVRGLRDSEVAILHEAAQPRLVHGVLRSVHAEALLALAHRCLLAWAQRLTTSPVSMSM